MVARSTTLRLTGEWPQSSGREVVAGARDGSHRRRLVRRGAADRFELGEHLLDLSMVVLRISTTSRG